MYDSRKQLNEYINNTTTVRVQTPFPYWGTRQLLIHDLEIPHDKISMLCDDYALCVGLTKREFDAIVFYNRHHEILFDKLTLKF